MKARPLFPPSRPTLLLALTLAATLAACGSGDGSSSNNPSNNETPTDYSALPGANANAQILAEQVDEAGAQPASLPAQLPEASAVRFLNQATFGSTEAETASVQQQWRSGWLQAQFALPLERTHWDRVTADQAALLAAEPARDPNQLPNAVWDWSVWEAYISAPDQLRKRVGYALSQIMVASMEGFASGGTNNARLAAGYMDALEKGAFGNFRELLENVTLV